jgi:hypothetical protein
LYCSQKTEWMILSPIIFLIADISHEKDNYILDCMLSQFFLVKTNLFLYCFKYIVICILINWKIPTIFFFFFVNDMDFEENTRLISSKQNFPSWYACILACFPLHHASRAIFPSGQNSIDQLIGLKWKISIPLVRSYLFPSGINPGCIQLVDRAAKKYEKKKP